MALKVLKHPLGLVLGALFFMLLPMPVSGDAPSPHNAVNGRLQNEGAGPDMEQKIGQMILAGFRGLTAASGDAIVRDIRRRHLGGVILYDTNMAGEKEERNIASAGQVKKLIRDLQSHAAIPLIVAIDYEGGKVNRLKDDKGFPPTVSHHYLGDKNDPDLTFRHAARMSKTLSELGFNLNLAPVADLMSNPDNPIIARLERSFSADPEKVSRHALAFIEGSHEHGILTSLKHFPGHGSSATDSHLGMTDVTRSWSSRELEPFRAVIEAKKADTIMTAHVFNTRLDARYPATLSRPVITGLLRKELQFDGVVISDDLGMRAITDLYGLETALLKTIEAGVDMIIISNNTGVADQNVTDDVALTIRRLVDEGRITEARIDESFRRILKLKSRIRPAS